MFIHIQQSWLDPIIKEPLHNDGYLNLSLYLKSSLGSVHGNSIVFLNLDWLFVEQIPGRPLRNLTQIDWNWLAHVLVYTKPLGESPNLVVYCSDPDYEKDSMMLRRLRVALTLVSNHPILFVTPDKNEIWGKEKLSESTLNTLNTFYQHYSHEANKDGVGITSSELAKSIMGESVDAGYTAGLGTKLKHIAKTYPNLIYCLSKTVKSTIRKGHTQQFYYHTTHPTLTQQFLYRNCQSD